MLLLFSHSVVSNSVTPWNAARQASLSTIPQSLLKLMSIKSVMPSNHFILCCPLLLLPSIFPSIRGFSKESDTTKEICTYTPVLRRAQFSSAQSLSWPTLFNPMDFSTLGLPVYHQLLKLVQTHAHRVSDAIQPSHPLSSPSPPAFNLSQHQGLFQRVSFSYQAAKVLAFQLQHQSFQ